MRDRQTDSERDSWWRSVEHALLHLPFLLPQALLDGACRHGEGFLDLAHDEDAGQHLLHLLAGDGLGRVPDGAVGGHHRLRGQVERIVPTLRCLRTDAEHGTCSAGSEQQPPTVYQIMHHVVHLTAAGFKENIPKK